MLTFNERTKKYSVTEELVSVEYKGMTFDIEFKSIIDKDLFVINATSDNGKELVATYMYDMYITYDVFDTYNEAFKAFNDSVAWLKNEFMN